MMMTIKEKSAGGAIRKGSHLGETLEIDRIEKNFDVLRQNARFNRDSIGIGARHREIFVNARMFHHAIFPDSAVRMANGRHTGEGRQRRHSIEMMLRVDYVRRKREIIEISCH